jgi:hypothetical protein
MTQALYAHMNNKRKKMTKISYQYFSKDEISVKIVNAEFNLCGLTNTL